jgi:site-specific DNA-methyltransferase (adenine-specific)
VLDIHFGENLDVIRTFPDASFDLIYIDPPFNTGKVQARTRIQTVRDEEGDRVGFQGKRYRSIKVGTKAYSDSFNDYLGFLEPRLEEARRLLKSNGSFFFHIDYREVHYCKILLDSIFGRESFLNEIIWAYDYGARATRRWSPKHDNILWYAKDPENYTYRFEDIDRIPYMAPGLVGPEKAERGKTPTDTWWNTIVSPNGKEKTGYPTQKPLAIINRIVRVHSNPGDRVLDFFAGSGTLGESAVMLGRQAVLVDCNPEAIAVMRRRFAHISGVVFHGCEGINQPVTIGMNPNDSPQGKPTTPDSIVAAEPSEQERSRLGDCTEPSNESRPHAHKTVVVSATPLPLSHLGTSPLTAGGKSKAKAKENTLLLPMFDSQGEK